jgi:predicted amidohydrolase YtcJ
MDKNVTLAFGSDWFVAPPVPVLGIGAAATRLTLQQIEDLDIHQQRQHASVSVL